MNNKIFEQMSLAKHEQVVFCNDHRTGLRAIIAIHNTQLGPALGGCRMYPYTSEEDALHDVLRLSQGMTYKSAVAGLNFGGGKAVIIGDPKKLASEALFRAFGRFVNSFNGRYITAEDVGTKVQFMEWVRQETKHVTGIPTYFGGSGDPSPFTAHGAFVGIKAALQFAYGNDSLKGIKVAVEGVGNVGANLCRELYDAGAILTVADVNPEAAKRAAKEFGATVLKGNAFYSAPVDVYAPCALGATINDKTLALLKCKIVAGSANNQLEVDAKHGAELSKRGILYAPDFVINAGGLFNVNTEIEGGGREHAWKKIENIYHTLLRIFEIAAHQKISTSAAANHVAEERLRAISAVKEIYRA